ncbi:serine/threonine-protein phosphatase 7 long form-like protein [Rhynchospora pubera]|uniref:Serine/threonine-protein phosphatase 7 long form-like protein n=1 Tax=Rhynchospora pubera TaxID=906938 RepID=A0AAV8FUM5_9POAL|nr:serine/threonine-protein phosphatase 7 long form-like protein [Rhynchospora pubera]
MHKAKMIRTEEVDQRLVTLDLIHFVELGHMPLDRSMIQGLAMFWRPETHTFHFPRVGEMTVTLEDVAFIFGLPTTGRPVTGRTDYDDVQKLADFALPRDTLMEDVLDCFRERATDRRAGRKLHAVQFGKLRDMWAQGPGSEDADRIDRYTRALVLELMGCEMFPDTTGDSVTCFYLELLRDVHASDSVRYNWGAATLAMLYRGLDLAVLANGAQKVPAPQWTTRLRSKKVKGPVRSGIEYARDVLMKMEHAHVVWQPYEDELRQVVMPPYARYEQRYYRLRYICR